MREREREGEREGGRKRETELYEVVSLIREQVNCARAKKTAYPGVQVFGW